MLKNTHDDKEYSNILENHPKVREKQKVAKCIKKPVLKVA